MHRAPSISPSISPSRRALAVTFLALAPTVLLAEDWPQWRGRDRANRSAETGLLRQWPEGGPPLAWRGTGLGAGYSTVAVADGTIYTLGDLGDTQYLFALGEDDGRLKWKVAIGRRWECEFGYSGPRSTPTVDDDRLFVISTDGELLSLRSEDGAVLWRRHLVSELGGRLSNDLWAWTESPLIDGERVLVTPGGEDSAMVALDKSSGREIWRAHVPTLGDLGADGAAYSSIVVSHGAGVKQYVQLLGRGVVGIEAESGRFLWGYNGVANDVANISTPIVTGDLVLASTGYDTGTVLLRLHREGTGVRAEEVYFLPPNRMQNHHGGLVLHDGVVYLGQGHNKGFPLAVVLETGEAAWGPVRNEGQGSASVVYADGHLVYRYQSGHVLWVEATPEEYRQKGSFQLPEVRKESWPHPVIANGRLYLREDDNLWVYDLRSRSSVDSTSP